MLNPKNGYELHFTEAIQNKHGYQDYDMPYNGDGYFFDGNGSTAREENASFTLKSNSFTLSGVGLVSMKMAGRSLRFSLVDETDSSKNITFLNPCYLIKNYTVTESGNIPLSEGRMNTMTRVYVDAKALLGDMVHVEISDSDANYDWGLIFFDDLYTNYTSYPHFQIDKISQEYDSDGTHYGPYHGIVKDYFYSGNNPTATDFSSAYSFVSSWWGFRTSANNFSRCSGYATLQSSYGALSEAAKAIVRNSQDFDFGSYSGNFYDNEANTSLTIGDAISLTNW